MISSIFSFALGRDTEVESRKPTSPKVRIFDFAFPMSARCSVTKSLSSRSSLAILSLWGLLCSSAAFLAPRICLFISPSMSWTASCASAI